MDHVHSPYPSFDLKCVTTLWTMLVARAIRSNLPSAAKHFYVLLGAALGLLVGEPEDVQPIFGDAQEADDATLKKLLTELEGVQADGVPETFGAGEDDKAGNPVVIALITALLPVLIDAIKKRLENRRN